MSHNELIEILRIVIWPAVAVSGILVLRPHLAVLLAGSKLKLSLFGQSIETTLSELGGIIEEQTGGSLKPREIDYLESLYEQGPRDYPEGMSDEDHKLLRPLRNFGLIMTIPRHSILNHAKSIQLTSLGRLYVKARQGQHGRAQ